MRRGSTTLLTPLDEAVDDEDEDGEPVAFSQIAHQATDVFALHQRDEAVAGAAAAESEEPASRRHGKLINDAIHKLIRLDPDACAIVDTPEFQRLRDLKQLGLSYLVYPCASHSRFEHSLGTYHLAERWATHFGRCQPELGVKPKEIKLVSLAGLCHDLGHGPFSHLFDNEVIPQLRAAGRISQSREWSHEAMSCQMLQHLYDENGLEDTLAPDSRSGLQREDLQTVKELISIDKRDYDARGVYHGTHSQRPQLRLGERMFLYEIVANGRNSVDIDKFDYLLRDGRACGIATAFDHDRLIQLSKVIDGRICFKRSEALGLYNLFTTRASMHQIVYTHAKAKAIEFMVSDALVAADRYFNFDELIWEPSTFKRLDDTLLKQIEWSSAPELADARVIVDRLRRRELYKLASELSVPEHMLASWSRVSATDIVDHAPLGCGLRVEDVIVDNKEINYSMKARDPVSSIQFFEQLHSTEARPLDKSKVSSMLPQFFEDKKVRVYVRDASKLNAAIDALQNFARHRHCTSPTRNTPVKRPRVAGARESERSADRLSQSVARSLDSHGF